LLFLQDLASNNVLFLLYRHPQQSKSVSEKSVFDFLVQGARSAKTRSMVDLKQQWLAVLVNYDVESQYLETHKALLVGWLACVVVVRKVFLNR
jgi:hypothetical protein